MVIELAQWSAHVGWHTRTETPQHGAERGGVGQPLTGVG